MPASSEKWKHFERLVAAIHQAADRGADVRWDDAINGRQFDVTIRFRKGLYEYLTVIECKDYSKPVPVEKIEAFVTKSRDVHAHHAVMASTSGFQTGAREVADRHNITLIHVSDSEEINMAMFRARWTGTTLALHLKSIELIYSGGEKHALPEEANAMAYYCNEIQIQVGPYRNTLNEIIEAHRHAFSIGQLNEYSDNVISCPAGAAVVTADDGEFPLKPIVAIRVVAGVTEARTLTSPIPFDAYLLVPGVKVKNVSTGDENTFRRHDLPLGLNSSFSPDTFYELPTLAAYYYCESVDGEQAMMYLVESFQTGKLFQAQFLLAAESAKFYVPVTDRDVITRLQRRLDRLRTVTGTGVHDRH